METLGHRFKVYVRQVTDLPVTWGEPVDIRLPTFLAQRYEAHDIWVADQSMIAVVVKDQEAPAPTILYKQVQHLLALLGVKPGAYCLVADQLPTYLRRRLVEMRMPFVIPGRQLYWPALGNAETHQRPRRLQPTPVTQLGPASQQLLIAMLLKLLPRPTAISGAAKILGYTAMSMSRAVKELEGAALISSTARGRLRTFVLCESPSAVWGKALPKLRSPVMGTIRVLHQDLPPSVSILAGESALAECSHLAAPQEQTVAIASRVWTRLHREVPIIPTVDKGTCRVQLWRYAPDITAQHGRVDPLSLFLSLREHPDERIQQSLETIMEQMPW